MKIYLHLDFEKLTNCYLVVNEETKKALIIDPCKISNTLIKQIEEGGYDLTAVFITHKHENHYRGLKTLKKIYDFSVYAADNDLSTDKNILKGEGVKSIGGLNVEYFSLPGHSSDSMVYKIENAIFTGDVIFAGKIGSSSCSYTSKYLAKGIKSKIFSLNDGTVIMPGHGPITTVGAEKQYNLDLSSI
ncbi:MAG: MBL fold metallo-hydrolase [Treponema sp.]|nr:MBL fold metallo-hydrolase [Treponema sp.]